MPKPTKPAESSLTSWDEVDAAGLLLLRRTTDAETLQGKLDLRVAQLKDISKGAIQEAQAEADRLLDDIELFMGAHQDDLTDRSRVLTHTRVGFRKSLEVRKELTTWDAVGQKIFRLGEKFAAFVRLGKPAPDKQAILKAFRAGELTAKQLERMGVAIDPDREIVFCELATNPVAAPN